MLDAAAREDLVKRAAGKSTREVMQMVAEVDPELAQPNDRMRALGGGRWELKAAVDAKCRHGLEKLQMLLSHQDPHLTLGALVARLVRDGLDRYDPARPPRVRRSGGRTSANGERSASEPARREQEAVQRNVASAIGGAVERRSEVEPGDVSVAAARSSAPRPSTARLDTEAERGGAQPAAVRGGHWFPTSAAKRLADAAGHGAVAPVAHSPALQRHRAALSSVSAMAGSRSRYVPVAVKREVWRRDQGCCSFVDPHSGRRCGSRFRLEIDHVVPFALGGGAEPGNLRIRCGAHHRYRHAHGQAHPASVPTETRRAPVFAVVPVARGQAGGSHAAIDRDGA